MKILMVSTDQALIGEKVATGDVVQRHRDYGSKVDRLDIIVFSGQGYQTKKLTDNVFSYPTNSRGRWSYVRDTVRIASEIFESGVYDLVVCQDPFLAGLVGVKLKKKFGIKLLVHFHGDFWDNKYWIRENYLRLGLLMVSKIVIKRADFIRVVSKGIKDKLIKKGIDDKKIKIISTPVNVNEFGKIDNQTVISISQEFKDKKIILWVGKMRKEKNLEFLMQVYKRVRKKYREVVLVLVGSGKDFEKLNKLRLELGLGEDVKMVGHVDYKILPNYFAASNILVLPSRHESFGKVLLEAGIAGKPVVASATTGAKEIIDDKKTGFLVEINNKKQLTDKLLKLLQDDELAGKMGKQGYDLIKHRFDYKKSVEAVINYWRKIAKL